MTDNHNNNISQKPEAFTESAAAAPPGFPPAVGSEEQSRLVVPGIRQVGPGGEGTTNNDSAPEPWDVSPAGEYTVQQRKLRELIPKTPSPSYSYDVNFGQAQAVKDGQQPAPIMPRFFPFMAPPPQASDGGATQATKAS
ncbi:hypothetical protein Pmar_PMAR010542 [Perkinsus marinus ATCC 50983]|uniref:Uncharacterized protein n=1 Tax=Perkinsus marinus (strain ATCC 50983 / TXsc) TaxID=423536 RepID=C5LKU2_PERM5|nr:hypothetical protein Pmar_PMAR010542 [Perkinsus marinus ATCC 50983]EER02651.1 hypothetical protein Pmar_PMAR010542 [Perkinsus marinus ATCC 50983]|eukprot:XP_002769933.1 hypothetical protein Pmar_PMAR010542 [Perkinsus marinus ATCC 50983]